MAALSITKNIIKEMMVLVTENTPQKNRNKKKKKKL